ncbi:MAG: hypothetical protein EBS66_10635 [Betaproteobacteria bacterium]|nr:hypothetical protein [Betaproteobacteria bacterium]
MAWYKWLNRDMVDPIWGTIWPELGEVAVNSGSEKGYHVYPGSRVCDSIPWRNLPARLFRVDVDGEYHHIDGQAFFGEVTPTVEYGELLPSDARVLAAKWFDLMIQDRYEGKISLQPELTFNYNVVKGWRDRMFERVFEGGEQSLLPEAYKSMDPWIIWASKAIESDTDEMAWCYALYLVGDVRTPKLGLALATVLDDVLKSRA